MNTTEKKGFEGLSSQKTNIDDILNSENIDESKSAETIEGNVQSMQPERVVYENTIPEKKSNSKNAWVWAIGIIFMIFIIGQMGSDSSVTETPPSYVEEAAPYAEEAVEPAIEEAVEPIYEEPTYEAPDYSEPIEVAVPYESEPYNSTYNDDYGQNNYNSY
jgi:hypothetical protein